MSNEFEVIDLRSDWIRQDLAARQILEDDEPDDESEKGPVDPAIEALRQRWAAEREFQAQARARFVARVGLPADASDVAIARWLARHGVDVTPTTLQRFVAVRDEAELPAPGLRYRSTPANTSSVTYVTERRHIGGIWMAVETATGWTGSQDIDRVRVWYAID